MDTGNLKFGDELDRFGRWIVKYMPSRQDDAEPFAVLRENMSVSSRFRIMGHSILDAIIRDSCDREDATYADMYRGSSSDAVPET